MFLLANAGLPMIFLEFPALVVALPAVVVIEVMVANRYLRPIPKRLWSGSAAANLTSTVLGFPLAWLLMLAVALVTTGGRALGIESPLQRIATVTLQAAWLVPYEGDFYWLVPIAAAVLLVPAFFVSVFIERAILRRLWNDCEAQAISRVVWQVNGFSYAVLGVAAAVWLAWSVAQEV